MGIEDAKSAFLSEAGGQLRIARFVMTYDGGGQVITCSGWHADDRPFVTTCEPFSGDPTRRAREIARDLIRTHTGWPAGPKREIMIEPSKARMQRAPGGNAMVASSIKTAAARMQGAFDRIASAVTIMADEAEGISASVEGTVEHGRAILKEAAEADREMRKGFGITDNGAPIGPLSGAERETTLPALPGPGDA